MRFSLCVNQIDLCKGDCEAVAEVERLRELAVEQQEVIELLRQAVKVIFNQ